MEGFKVENGNLVFPEGITKVDRKSFRKDGSRAWVFDRESVTTVVIPNSVTEIEELAFDGFTNMKTLSIPNSVKSIGEVAFRNCVSLKDLSIPASVEVIVEDAFYRCSSLDSIIVNEDNTHYDSRNNCNAIIETATNILIQGGNKTVIPSTVEIISHSAFMNCTSLEEIEISKNVTSIGDAAFWGCCNLRKLCIKNPKVQIGMNAFYGTPYQEEYSSVHLSKREQ